MSNNFIALKTNKPLPRLKSLGPSKMAEQTKSLEGPFYFKQRSMLKEPVENLEMKDYFSTWIHRRQTH
jgi:hypothetical protein